MSAYLKELLLRALSWQQAEIDMNLLVSHLKGLGKKTKGKWPATLQNAHINFLGTVNSVSSIETFCTVPTESPCFGQI